MFIGYGNKIKTKIGIGIKNPFGNGRWWPW